MHVSKRCYCIFSIFSSRLHKQHLQLHHREMSTPGCFDVDSGSHTGGMYGKYEITKPPKKLFSSVVFLKIASWKRTLDKRNTGLLKLNYYYNAGT